MPADNRENISSRSVSPVDSLILSRSALIRKVWPVGFHERKFLLEPEEYWGKLVSAIWNPKLWRGLRWGAQVGGARYNPEDFLIFVDYAKILPETQSVTDPQVLSKFIEDGETRLFRDGILPAYLNIQEVGEGQPLQYTPKAIGEIDELRSELFGEMYRRFLTDSYGGLEPGFKHYFIKKTEDIGTYLKDLIWQLKLPMIGAGELYQLSAQANSGETITLQEVLLEKMMEVLQEELTGEQMANFVTRAQSVLKQEIQKNRGDVSLCRALGGCLRMILNKAETQDDQKYSQYLAAKIALPEAITTEEVDSLTNKIANIELLRGLEPGLMEESDKEDKFALPILRIKAFWGELATDLIDKTWGYDGEANVTEALVTNLGRVMTHLGKAPEEVQAAFLEIGEQVLKKAITASEKTQLLSVFETLISSLKVDKENVQAPLTAGHKYLAIIRATYSEPFVETMIADFRNPLLGVGGSYPIVDYLKPEWTKMIETISTYPEEYKIKLLDASQLILDAIAGEPNPSIQNELALLYAQIYTDVESLNSVGGKKPEELALRDWVSQAAKHQALELYEDSVLREQYFDELFGHLVGPCGFDGRVDLSPIFLKFNMEVISAIETMEPEKQASFVEVLLSNLEKKVAVSRNKRLQKLYIELSDAFYKEQ